MPNNQTTAPLRRRLSAAVAVLLTVLGLMLVLSPSASAAPATSAVAAADVTPDGCTLVPAAPSGVDFTPACNSHDICYATKAGTRSQCDSAFLSDLLALCRAGASSAQVYRSCLGWAYTYYFGVRVFGGYFYNATDPSSRVYTPIQG